MSKYREWNFKLGAKRTSVYQQSKREFQSEIQAAKPCQCKSSLHISHDHGLSARQLAENLESQDGRQYPGSHLVVEGTQNTGEDDVWECAIDQLEEHEEVNSSSEQFSAGNFKSKNLLSEHN
jgi:hypothetical protein